MNQYGAWLGRDGKAPPFPRYSEMPAEQVAKLPKPSAAYMDGFRKDYDSYFKGIFCPAMPLSNPSSMSQAAQRTLGHCISFVCLIHCFIHR